MKKALALLFISIISIAAIYAAVLLIYLNRPVVTAQSGVIFNVPRGMSKKEMIAQLHQQGIITHNWLYTTYVMLHPKMPLKTGEYLFPQGATPHAIWRQMSAGRGFYYRSFTIVPGWTFQQVRQQLDKAEALRHFTQGTTDETIMVFLGHPGIKPEGQFYPETYYYTRGDQDLVILQRAYDYMQRRLDEVWQGRAADVPFKTKEEALIAASIVEKEAYLDSERPIIAGVMVNRLKIGMPLQFDPTVIYGLGSRYDGKIYKKDLLEDTPYNTYVHKGLTPTPISMPGPVSLEAVTHPAVHDYLYFVAKGDGGHQFSATLQAHQAAVDASRAREALHQAYFNTGLIQQYLLRYTSVALLENVNGAR